MKKSKTFPQNCRLVWLVPILGSRVALTQARVRAMSSSMVKFGPLFLTMTMVFGTVAYNEEVSETFGIGIGGRSLQKRYIDRRNYPR